MRRKTVLRVSSQIYPESIGGIGIHVDKLAADLTKRGWENIVLTVKLNREAKTEVRNGYKIVRVPSRMQLFGNEITPLMLRKLLELKSAISIIHAHSHLFFSTNVAALFRRISSLPFVITCHGVWSQTVPMNFQQLYMRSIGVLTLNSADGVICYTNEEKQVLKRLGVKENKIVVIPNGVDTCFFTPSSKLSSNSKLLWVGRFVRGKRPDIPIKAMINIQKEIPGASLRMVGSGPLKSYCCNLVNKYRLSRSIQFLSHVSDEQLLRLYRESSVVLLSSEQEGVPRTILEALSCSIPVVVSDLPQIRSVIRNCGFYFRTGNIEDMAEKTAELLLNSKLRREFGKIGHHRVCENYSWDRLVNETIRVYESLISNA